MNTGATFLGVPEGLACHLRLPRRGTPTTTIAHGKVTFDRSLATLQVQERTPDSPVLISPLIDRVLLGVLTLEALGLKVNPVTGTREDAEVVLLKV